MLEYYVICSVNDYGVKIERFKTLAQAASACFALRALGKYETCFVREFLDGKPGKIYN